ncbi:hypothetical protein P3F83_15205 [Mycobacteroides immunogenum]|uniref:hypothetical protein n=1 Tax=Mycobacteroides immunogenum TaxID=83262 RepID=UPI0025B76179|nr:hypothetical protein [Mycobacteroides immunogenum]WJR31918.1 hypothetical protein P3F83_15205 [Mycobacteroides immunogenum]
MSIRAYAFVVAAVLLIAGAAVMIAPTHEGAVRCGDGGFNTYSSGSAQHQEVLQDNTRELQGYRVNRSSADSIGARCESAMMTRRYIAIPLFVVGVLTLLGAVAVRAPSASSMKPDSPAP